MVFTQSEVVLLPICCGHSNTTMQQCTGFRSETDFITVTFKILTSLLLVELALGGDNVLCSIFLYYSYLQDARTNQGAVFAHAFSDLGL